MPLGIGGYNSNILHEILNPKRDLGRSWRKYHRTLFREQNRGKGDPWQKELIAILRETLSSLFPLNKLLLTSSCTHCEVAGEPTRQCRHFHVLTEADIIREPKWITAPIIFASHSATDYVIEFKMSQFTKSKG